MRRLTQKIISWMCTLTLTASLGSAAFADDGEPVLPAEAPTEIIGTPAPPEMPGGTAVAAGETGGDAAQGTGSDFVSSILPEEEELLKEEDGGNEAAEEAGKSIVEGSGVSAAGEDDPEGGSENGETGSDPVAEVETVSPAAFESAGTAAIPEENASVQSTDDSAGEQQPVLITAGEVIDPETGGSGEGWSYNTENGSITLTGFDGSQQSIGTVGSDITIKLSGLNRLSDLIVDGDINLVGTGILLIDNIELAEGCKLHLQTNKNIYEDETGSVAVFLRQEDEEGNCSYVLINGSVPGILDEDINLS